ncbi:phosphoglucosamine mutase [Thermoleophilum album]|uniref:Phosphoglucosamine mutase n=1 Tax=Thermoleophilum album TaxID=29539 RepID=A0A1H6FS78_THEAL|nr:phosphoglucosamine mutase [Thermoleophilum album]SEH13761.1 phosphoglucosamine mutase [Thermoleophilum album]
MPARTPGLGTGETGRLFGTDGVRGVAGATLTAELALALGRALVEVHGGRPRVLIARDTRSSGPMLEAALAAGIAAAGGDALLAGVLPTPAAALVAPRLGLEFGAVISASHNPWQDNGIKFLGSDGTKIPDNLEREIERALATYGAESAATRREAADRKAAEGAEESAESANRTFGAVEALHGAQGDYLRLLEARFCDLDLSGKRVALDCANGATWETAPTIFRRLGAEVVELGCEPDGRNINRDCGSTAPAKLVAAVKSQRCDLGFAFDGDGDRVVAVDRAGRVHDGDDLLAIIAPALKERGALRGNGVAVTVMTNYGFHREMRRRGIEVAVTPVGDRHVQAELARRDWVLGGEQSGHIIDRRFAPTGDGVASALLLLESLAGRDLADGEPFSRMPQTLLNVPVRDRDGVSSNGRVRAAIEAHERALAGEGRVLVRPSGTEQLVRVMVEAPDPERCERIANELAQVVAAELG